MTSDRIQRGIEYLDEHAPGWEQRVDLNALDLSDGASCVLGQLFGDHDDAVWDLDINPEAYGFMARANEAYRTLTAKWCAVIAERRLP